MVKLANAIWKPEIDRKSLSIHFLNGFLIGEEIISVEKSHLLPFVPATLIYFNLTVYNTAIGEFMFLLVS